MIVIIEMEAVNLFQTFRDRTPVSCLSRALRRLCREPKRTSSFRGPNAREMETWREKRAAMGFD